MASDNSGSSEGWRVDTVTMSGCEPISCETPTATPTPAPAPTPRSAPTPSTPPQLRCRARDFSVIKDTTRGLIRWMSRQFVA